MLNGFQLGGLSIEVLRYQFENWDNYYDANWLVVSVELAESETNVAFTSPCLMTSDLVGFLDAVVEMDAGETNEAVLGPIEPNLHINLNRVGSLGSIAVVSELLVEPQMLEVGANFSIDASYLPKLIKDLREVVRRFPVRLEDVKSV